MWTKEQINKHIETARILDKIKDETFEFIRIKMNELGELREKDVQKFILRKFNENNIKTDKDPPIVAFGKNTANVHYFCEKNSKLKENSVILLDIWAKFRNTNFPFADITWMGYYGKKIPKEIQEMFSLVTDIRDKTIKFIKTQVKRKIIPSGRDISKIAIDILNKNELGNKMNHYLGHSIGFTSPHGNKKGLNPSNSSRMITNLGYTIEPGIYLKNKFGVRSEINFFISNKNRLVLTTKLQTKITPIFKKLNTLDF